VVWSCEEGHGGRRVAIGGGNGSVGEKESRKTNENLERYNEEAFGAVRSG